jgi:hypothetical protein
LTLRSSLRNVGGGSALNIHCALFFPHEPDRWFAVPIGTLETGRNWPALIVFTRPQTLPNAEDDWDAGHWNWRQARLVFSYSNIFGDAQNLIFHCTGASEINNETNATFVGDVINLNDTRQFWLIHIDLEKASANAFAFIEDFNGKFVVQDLGCTLKSEPPFMTALRDSRAAGGGCLRRGAPDRAFK